METHLLSHPLTTYQVFVLGKIFRDYLPRNVLSILLLNGRNVVIGKVLLAPVQLHAARISVKSTIFLILPNKRPPLTRRSSRVLRLFRS